MNSDNKNKFFEFFTYMNIPNQRIYKNLDIELEDYVHSELHYFFEIYLEKNYNIYYLIFDTYNNITLTDEQHKQLVLAKEDEEWCNGRVLNDEYLQEEILKRDNCTVEYKKYLNKLIGSFDWSWHGS